MHVLPRNVSASASFHGFPDFFPLLSHNTRFPPSDQRQRICLGRTKTRSFCSPFSDDFFEKTTTWGVCSSLKTDLQAPQFYGF